MNKLLLPIVTIAASFVYLLDLLFIFIKKPNLIGVYFSSAEGTLFIFMALASLLFYFLVKKTPVFIQNRGMFFKIFMQLLIVFIILFFPLAYYDITSDEWFSGLGTIIISIAGIISIIIFSVVAYFLQRNQVVINGRIKLLNFFHLILSLVILVWFSFSLYGELQPYRYWKNYQVQVEYNQGLVQ